MMILINNLRSAHGVCAPLSHLKMSASAALGIGTAVAGLLGSGIGAAASGKIYRIY